MTDKQWEEIGGVADQQFVDWGMPASHDFDGWAEYVMGLGIITEEEVEKLGGWEKFFWEACEWA